MIVLSDQVYDFISSKKRHRLRAVYSDVSLPVGRCFFVTFVVLLDGGYCPTKVVSRTITHLTIKLA